MILLTLLCLTQGVQLSLAQECSIPDAERRDCYPWPGASEEACEDRGCVWCPASSNDFPWCYYDDKVCPSEIPEGERADCLPDGGGKDDCTARGCVWCEAEGDNPFCFEDPAVKMGGDFCPAEIGYSVGEIIDCWPDTDVTREGCLAKGCYWCPGNLNAEPWCYAPKEYGYRMVGEPEETPNGFEVTLKRVNYPSWFGEDVEEILLEVELQSDDRLRIKFSNPAEDRFEVPVEIEPPRSGNDDLLYDVEFVNEPAFGIRVIRKSSEAVIFDTTIGGLTFAKQFLQIATKLDSANVYGFGEHEHHSLRHNMTWEKWGMWTRDQAVTTSNLYGQEPFYLNVEESGAANGVFFKNANAQDVTLQPDPAILFRTTGGILDIYLFLGPSPEEVIQQFTQAVGTPVFIPYWSLGFQLCRWGYKNIGEMKEAIARMREYNIPHDVQYGDIDYMDGYRDFTIDDVNFAGLSEYVDELKQEGTRYVIILDPGISYIQEAGTYPTFDRGEELEVWVMDESGENPARGHVWPGPTYFPDFTKDSTETWWVNECVIFYEQLDYAALWIDMNEVSNFTDIDNDPTRCANNNLNHPPFLPAIADNMFEKTLCMDTQQAMGLQYDVHSLYGWSMSKQSFPAARTATGLRSVVFSRSTFPGTGKYAQHWLGDNFSEWSNLKWSIIGMLEFNMFGMPYTGADVCGFIGVPTEEMCLRWQQLGAFYPFSRNHNADDQPPQDPGIWESVANAARESLHIRYRMLPYLYTNFYNVNVNGGTVVKPLFFEFGNDATALGVDEQFMWGPAVLVSPALFDGQRTVDAYFPDARWYEYETGEEISARSTTSTLDVPLERVPVHFRGGYVVPTQREANSTLFSRENPMGLIVALGDSDDARGTLFWDDGEGIDTIEEEEFLYTTFTVADGTLTSTISVNGYSGANSLVLDDIDVLGVSAEVSEVTINGEDFEDWDFDEDTGKLTISNAGLSVTNDFSVSWA